MTQVHNAAAPTLWPAERFYWAVLEAPGWSRSGVLPEGLRAEFEDETPDAPEGLHAVCTPLGDGRVLVCAARREDLEGLDPQSLALWPAALPGCVGEVDAPDEMCAALNLLVGPFEPRSLRRARAARHLVAAATVGLCAVLVAAGLSRRGAHWSGVADAAAQARATLVREIAPANALHPEALLAELARVRQGHDGAARVRPPADAALALAALLRAWPAEVPAATQSVAVTGAEASVSVNVEGDPGPFLRAMGTPECWTKGEPRMNAVGGGATRIVLTLTAEPTRAAP